MSIYVDNDWLPMPIILEGGAYLSKMSRDDFFDFCRLNADTRIERDAAGGIVIMTPAGGETGRRNLQLSRQVGNWAEEDGTGIAFDSSTGFWLPNGAKRSPDVSWIRRERWESLTRSDKDKFPPLAPDFVIELRSETDRFKHLQAKMQEYVDNGVRLGWLIDPLKKRVEIYRPSESVEVLENPTELSGEPELPALHVDLTKVW